MLQRFMSYSSHGVVQQLCMQGRRQMGHSVRVILTQDLPNGKEYKGAVLQVKAGFARNHLFPQKLAIYATPENFLRLGMEDPDVETPEQRAIRLAKEEASEEGGEDLKAADFLRHYLRNKVLKIWRKVDPQTQESFPGMVDAAAVREKLSKQLRIDLEEHETIHLLKDSVDPEEVSSDEIQAMVDDISTDSPCSLELRKVGPYVARITLQGGYAVPLKFTLLRS